MELEGHENVNIQGMAIRCWKDTRSFIRRPPRIRTARWILREQGVMEIASHVTYISHTPYLTPRLVVFRWPKF
jgi:hypothetical protein